MILALRLRLHRHWQRFTQRLRNSNTWALLAIDALAIGVAHILAHFIRFDFRILPGDGAHFFQYIPMYIAIRLPVFYVSGMYSGMWRYTCLRDVWNICKGVVVSSLIIIACLVIGSRFEGYSRSVVVLDTLFIFFFTCGVRISIRYILSSKLDEKIRTPKRPCKRLLIIGAGSSGEKTCREILENEQLEYNIIGFLDDDPSKNGKRIHNRTVWGSVKDLLTCVNEVSVDEILIAISAISGHKMQVIVEECKKTQLPYKIIPGYGEVIDGRVTGGMREVSYKDLLGREEIDLDVTRIGDYLSRKVILITGGGGSIGSELTRQVTKFKPQTIVIFEACEENLYNIQMELLHESGITNVVPVLGKVQDHKLLINVFERYQPQVVFHAAAYKHVPLVENNAWQAVDNNIVSSQLLMEAAIVYGVERFVVVSTDKAVRPTNVMGASKRMTELLMSAYRKNNWQGKLSPIWQKIIKIKKIEHKTIFMAVRFGNVLGSSGSVIPLFTRQIQRGGPVTVTHPKITRYFMSIEEAAQLILQAASMGRGGEIFLLKMGNPVLIADLARNLIGLAGLVPGRDIKIEYKGLREGEKLYEELITEGEGIVETGHDKIMVLTGEKVLSDSEAIGIVMELREQAKSFDGNRLRDQLKELMPEYAEMVKVNEALVNMGEDNGLCKKCD